MQSQPLLAAVTDFAQAIHHFTENLLNSETWAWEAYAGVRYAFLETYLELRDLAVQMQTARLAQGRAPSAAQRALAQHHAAFRDFQSLLIGVGDEGIATPPAVAEWPIRVIIAHVHAVERTFFATILNALHNPEPKRLRQADVAVLLGEAVEINDQLPLAESWGNYERLHHRVLVELSTLTDEQLAVVAPMWEPGPNSRYTVGFRLHRFDTHLREHTNQLEKTIRALNMAPNEAKLLLRQVYAALAEVEGVCLGAADVGQMECATLAAVIQERTASTLASVEQTQAMLAAVQTGDSSQVESLLATDKRLATARAENGLSLILNATYQGNHELAATLAAAKGELDIFEAAATGNLEEVKANLQYDPDSLNAFAADGFTPLQLACYFGREEIVQRLLEAGADVHAVAQNATKIQPLHAAVANGSGNLSIATMLLEKGAAPNAKQLDGFTPLMAAVQNQNEALVALLQDYGAVA